MRKLTLVLAACFALLAVSCQKDAELPDGGPAQFSAAAIGDTYFPKLAKNGSQKISFCASTEDNGVKEQCIATFKIGDASLVDVYNASVPQEMKGKAFPEGTCAFEKNDVTIDRFNRNSRTATLTVTNIPSMEGDTLYVLPIKLSTVTGSKNASADSNAVVFFTFYALNLDKGKGTKAEPFLIYEPGDLMNMAGQIKSITDDNKQPDVIKTKEAFDAAEPTYFKMVNDVDMSGYNWKPINTVSPYDLKVSFDGNHKTIKNLTYDGGTGGTYAGFFGVLCGEVYDLNLIDASISGGKDKSGLICGYLGTGDVIYGVIHGCKATGNLIVNNNTIGGIAGLMQGGEIYECEVDATITQLGDSRYYAGGIAGCGGKKPGSIHDCISKGAIISAGNLENNTYNRNAAGIAGAFETVGYGITNCISLASVHCNAVAAGILGHANHNSWAQKTAEEVDNYVIGCIAWNDEINADNTLAESLIGKRDDYAMGAGCIMGWGCPEITLQNCWRKPGIVFHATKNGEETHAQPFDQEDAAPGSPLQGINCDYKTYWESMYHGKAAGASETASQVAKRIGWDENIWDLSGDIPSLKNVYAK